MCVSFLYAPIIYSEVIVFGLDHHIFYFISFDFVHSAFKVYVLSISPWCANPPKIYAHKHIGIKFSCDYIVVPMLLGERLRAV